MLLDWPWYKFPTSARYRFVFIKSPVIPTDAGVLIVSRINVSSK